MEDVVAAHLIRAVGETAGVAVAGAGEQQLRGVGGARGHDDDVTGEALLRSVDVDHDRGDRATGVVGLEPSHQGVANELHGVAADCGTYGDHVGVRLGVDEAREAVAGGAPDARAERRLRLVEHDAAGRVEGMESEPREVVGEPLDAGLVGHRRMGVRP